MVIDDRIKYLYKKDTKDAYAIILELEALSEQENILVPYLDEFLSMLKSDKYVVRVRGFRLLCKQAKKLADAIDIARFTKRIVWQNIVFAFGIKGIFLLLGAAGVASMWEAVFADVGVTLLAVLNATRVIRRK